MFTASNIERTDNSRDSSRYAFVRNGNSAIWRDLHACDNEEWMAIHIDKTIQRRKIGDDRTGLADEDEEKILRCLGAALLLRWNTVPTKLQRELFDCASSLGDLPETTPLKGQIARFLHDHKDDQQNSN